MGRRIGAAGDRSYRVVIAELVLICLLLDLLDVSLRLLQLDLAHLH